MKIEMVLKDLLESFQGSNHIRLHVMKDAFNYSTHRYNDACKAIRDFGDCIVKNWGISGNSLCVTLENNAPTYLRLLDELENKEEK